LVHGLFGFDRIGHFELFHDVKQALREAGGQVFVPQLSATHDNEVRGQQLMFQIESVLRGTGAGKVNLIGIARARCRAVTPLRWRQRKSPRSRRSVAPITVRNWLTPAQGPDTGRSAGTRGGNAATLFASSRCSAVIGLPQNAVAALNALTTEVLGNSTESTRKVCLPAGAARGGAGQRRSLLFLERHAAGQLIAGT
jgi:triacylglycerol lipase